MSKDVVMPKWGVAAKVVFVLWTLVVAAGLYAIAWQCSDLGLEHGLSRDGAWAWLIYLLLVGLLLQKLIRSHVRLAQLLLVLWGLLPAVCILIGKCVSRGSGPSVDDLLFSSMFAVLPVLTGLFTNSGIRSDSFV